MASRKNNPKSDAASWVLIVVLFLVGALAHRTGSAAI